MDYEIGQIVTALVKGKITRIEGDYNDSKLRYFISGGHCVTAVVTDMEIRKSCKHCEGKGWIYVSNGPDDVDKEPCDCPAGLG